MSRLEVENAVPRLVPHSRLCIVPAACVEAVSVWSTVAMASHVRGENDVTACWTDAHLENHWTLRDIRADERRVRFQQYLRRALSC